MNHPLTELVKKELKEKGRFNIEGLCTIIVKPARKGLYNDPHTGIKKQSPKKNRVVFWQSVSFKKWIGKELG